MDDELTGEAVHRLISSDRVEGTAVYDQQGSRLGSIRNLMLEKRSGKAEYAVLQFGGFLGIGSEHYPIPWDMLDYDPSRGGYVIDIGKDKLESAPSYGNEAPVYDDGYGRKVYGYWGVPYPFI